LIDWIGLDWIGLDWIGLDWIGLDWIGAVASCSSDTTVKVWKLSECSWYQRHLHANQPSQDSDTHNAASSSTSDPSTTEPESSSSSSGAASTTSDGSGSGSSLRSNASTRTLKAHSDFVKALAVGSFGLASGGLDGRLHVWDVNASDVPVRSFSTAGALPSSLRSTLSWAPSSFSTAASIYSLTASSTEPVVVAGCCDSVVRVFDTRAAGISASASLLGHSDNVRAVQTIDAFTYECRSLCLQQHSC